MLNKNAFDKNPPDVFFPQQQSTVPCINPILFIDPFGLDTIPVNPDGSQVPIPLPGVDVSPTSNPATDNGTWWDGVVRFLWRVEYGISGNHNNSKNRDATKGEEWMIRHFDQSEVKDIGEAVGGNSGAQNSNTVNTDASYEGRSDEDIIEEAGGNNKDLIERKKRRTLPEPTQELEVFYRNRRTRTDSLNWIVNQDTFKVARKVKGGVIRYDFGYHEE